MATRLFQALAALTPLATCASAIAQQQQYTTPPPPPSYSQPADYQPAPANYQTPAPSNPQQRSYQPPPANYQAAPSYTSQQPPPYQAAPPPASYQTQQAPSSYQSPPAGYPAQPSYPPPQSYPSPQQPGYTQSSPAYPLQSYPQQQRSYQPQPAYQAPAPSYQAPAPSYPAQPASYEPPAGYPAQQRANYPPPAGYAPQQTASYPPSTPYESPPVGSPPPQPVGYAPQPAGYPSELLQATTRFSPYHTHVDVRYGHDRVYPDRGAIIRDAPRGALTVDYAGVAYRFSDGIWLEPRGPAFVAVSPPIGLVVPALPRSATIVTSNGENYLYANDTYYQARPDLKGYEVVNDPLDTTQVNASSQPMPPPAQAPAFARVAEPSEAQVTPAPRATARPVTPPAVVPASATVAEAGGRGTAAPSTGEAAASEPFTSVPPASERSAVTSLQISPENGQTALDQTRDRGECYRFAVLQSHFDPVHPDNTMPADEIARRRAGFQRAAAACFEGRGYAVR